MSTLVGVLFPGGDVASMGEGVGSVDAGIAGLRVAVSGVIRVGPVGADVGCSGRMMESVGPGV